MIEAVLLFDEILKKALRTNVEVPKAGDIAEIVAETERIDNEMQRLESQAKVAQEMAIALRIQTAAEVHIEEFYEYGGGGKVGVGADNKGLNIGASGSARRVTKRIYKFIGALAEPAGIEAASSAGAQKAKKVPAK